MKLFKISLLVILLYFIFMHFYRLPQQEFLGDEASPMYSIDRMWSGVIHGDIRFLAFPYLFYLDPYRSIFSGTLLHFFGPDRVLLRIPGILFGVATVLFMAWAALKEKIPKTLIVLSLLAYSVSGMSVNDRSGGGDALARFLILCSFYFLWKGKSLGFFSWAAGMLTMLDTTVLLPGVIYTIIKHKFLKEKKKLLIVGGITLFLAVYFFIWILFPYLAFKYGFQHYLSNRGLFYYFSRVSESKPYYFTGFTYLFTYMSAPAAIWLLVTYGATFFVKKLRPIQIYTSFAWIIIFALSRPSSHILMYAALFFFQAVLVTGYFIQKYPKFKLLTLFFILVLSYFNLTTFNKKYSVFFNLQYQNKSEKKGTICLSESVIRIYKEHNKKPLDPYCHYPLLQ